MGWKEDLAAELAEEGQKLRDAGVVDTEAEQRQLDEAEALKSQDQQIDEAGQTLRDNEVEYQGEADLNEVIQTVEDEGAPEIEEAPEPEPEAEAAAPYEPTEADYQDMDAYYAEQEAARTPEEIDAEQWAMAAEYEAEQAAQAEAPDVTEPEPEATAEVTEPATDTPEVTEPGAETAEVTEPEAEAPEVTEPDAPETDNFEAWADSKAPAAPEQGQELEQEQPEPEQQEMSFDEER